MKRSVIACGILLTCVLSAPAAAQGNQSQSQGGKARVASVTLTPTVARLLPGQCARFTAVAIDSKGKPVPGVTYTWNWGPPALFTPGQPGEVCVPSGILGGGNSGMVVTAMATDASTTNAFGNLISVQVPPQTYVIPILNPGGCFGVPVNGIDFSGATVANPPITWTLTGSQAASFKVTYANGIQICAANPLPAGSSWAQLTYMISATGEAKSISLQAAP